MTACEMLCLLRECCWLELWLLIKIIVLGLLSSGWTFILKIWVFVYSCKDCVIESGGVWRALSGKEIIPQTERETDRETRDRDRETKERNANVTILPFLSDYFLIFDLSFSLILSVSPSLSLYVSCLSVCVSLSFSLIFPVSRLVIRLSLSFSASVSLGVSVSIVLSVALILSCSLWLSFFLYLYVCLCPCVCLCLVHSLWRPVIFHSYVYVSTSNSDSKIICSSPSPRLSKCYFSLLVFCFS